MKSVGEAMAIGRTFKESLQKSLRSLEIGLPALMTSYWEKDSAKADDKKCHPGGPRDAIARTVHFESGPGAPHGSRSTSSIHSLCRIDPWFISRLQEIVAFGDQGPHAWPAGDRTRASRSKSMGSLGCETCHACRPLTEAEVRPKTPEPRRAGQCISAIRHLRGGVSFPNRRQLLDPSLAGRREFCEANPNRSGEGDDSGRRARTASGRGSNSTIAAVMPPLPFRSWVRNVHGQLQSGDGFDRLRHLATDFISSH